jgi:hypothetical protein
MGMQIYAHFSILQGLNQKKIKYFISTRFRHLLLPINQTVNILLFQNIFFNLPVTMPHTASNPIQNQILVVKILKIQILKTY